jgi:hypothetical protein
LYQYGGAYFDVTDVKPASKDVMESESVEEMALKAKSLSALFDEKKLGDLKEHLLFLEAQGQVPNSIIKDDFIQGKMKVSDGKFCVTSAEYLVELLKKDDDISNDSFICTARNPLMKEMLDKAKENYFTEKFYQFYKRPTESKYIRDRYSDSKEVSLSMAYGYKNVFSYTLPRTGPPLIRAVLRNEYKEEASSSSGAEQKGMKYIYHSKKSQVHLMRDPASHCLTSPQINKSLWLQPQELPVFNNQKEAIAHVIKLMKFEIGHFNILRLDDYVRDIAELKFIGEEEEKEEKKPEKNRILTELIEGIPIDDKTLEKIHAVQCAFKNEEVTKYCLSNPKIIPKIFILSTNENEYKLMLHNALNLDILHRFNQGLNDQMDFKNMHINPQILKQWGETIEQACMFLMELSRALKSSTVNSQREEMIIDHARKLMNYAANFVKFKDNLNNQYNKVEDVESLMNIINMQFSLKTTSTPAMGPAGRIT